MKRIVTLASLSLALCLTTTAAFAQSYGSPVKAVVRTHRSFAPATPIVNSYWPHGGDAGTLVTISGDNFVHGTKIVYGGTIVTPRRLTASLITFQIPRRANDAAISLRAPNKRWDVSVGTFDVHTTARWQRAFMASAPVKAELSLHNARIARLQRLKVRAYRAALLARIDAAIRKELRRHANQMTRLELAFRIG